MLLQPSPLNTNTTSLGNPNLQTMFHMQHNRKTWAKRMTFNHLNTIIPNYGGHNCLHLKETQVLAQATPRSYIIHNELVRWYVIDSSLLIDPSLELELQAIITLYG